MKKILVIDDDKDILEVVRISLEFYGFDVRTLPTGADALDTVRRYQPDLILLDIILPGKSGLEICKELRNLYNEIPVILFSALAEKGKEFSACKANGFIKKPFDINEFVDTVKLHVR